MSFLGNIASLWGDYQRKSSDDELAHISHHEDWFASEAEWRSAVSKAYKTNKKYGGTWTLSDAFGGYGFNEPKKYGRRFAKKGYYRKRKKQAYRGWSY